MSQARPWTGPMRLGLAVALTGLLAACGSTTSSTAPDGSAIVTPAPSPALSAAAPTAPVTASQAPIVTASVAPSPSSDVQTASAAAFGGAAVCSGNDNNRGFFETFASSVIWDVYCAVMPDGWFVSSGSYHLRDGGQLDVVYQGPNGARLELQEGSFCSDGASACSPHDSWLGSAQFGDQPGQLASLNGGGTFAIYVDPGQKPAWEVTGSGLDRQSFVDLAQSLVAIRP